MMTVLMDDYLSQWKERIEFVEARVLRKGKTDEPLDVAFVEGAITADEQAEKLKKLRARTKKLIAIGSCACTGAPSALRNEFDLKRQEEIEFILDRFKYVEKVRKIEDIVSIDGKVVGCPMNTKLFLETLNSLFIESGLTTVDILEKHQKEF